MSFWPVYRSSELVYIFFNRLEYGTKNPSKYTDTKSKEIKGKESEGTFEKKRDSIKVKELKYYYVFPIGLML